MRVRLAFLLCAFFLFAGRAAASAEHGAARIVAAVSGGPVAAMIMPGSNERF